MRTSAAIAVLTGLAVGAAVWWSGGGRPAAGPIAAETRAAEPGTDAKPPAEKPAGDRAEPADAAPREAPVKDEPVKDEPVKTVLSGRVVLLKEAFKARGIKSYDEEIAGQVVLVTREGELVP